MSERATDFSTLYRTYAPELYRFALYLCADHAAAEDVVAETFARVWTGTTAIVSPTVRAYLFTIAHNLVRRGSRHARRHIELTHDVVDESRAADVRVEASDTLRAVHVRLSALPELDQSAIAMRVAGLTYEDIAQVLGISAGNARVRVHRARLALEDIR